MVKIVKDESGLTPQMEKFAVALAQGLSQADAYRAAYDVKPQTKAKSVHESASRLAKDINVKSRVRQLLSEARVADIDNVGQAWRDLLDMMEEARKEGNFNAAAQFMRQRLTGLGALQHHVTVKHQSTLSDEQIVERLAGGDENLASVLRSVLGTDGFETTQH